jgi:hypothetical protein
VIRICKHHKVTTIKRFRCFEDVISPAPIKKTETFVDTSPNLGLLSQYGIFLKSLILGQDLGSGLRHSEKTVKLYITKFNLQSTDG